MLRSINCGSCKSRTLSTRSARDTATGEPDVRSSERLLCAIWSARFSSDEAAFASSTRSLGILRSVASRYKTLPAVSSGFLISWLIEAEIRPATTSFSDAISECTAWSFSCWVMESMSRNRRMFPASAGAARTKRTAVGTDAAAQRTLTTAAAGYTGHQTVINSITWVAPQATMKVPNATSIHT